MRRALHVYCTLLALITAACGGTATVTPPRLDAGAPESPNGSCYAGPPSATATTLVSGLNTPLNLAVDDDTIYFDDNDDTSGDGLIKSARKSDGGNLTLLADLGLHSPGSFLADGDYLYFRLPDLQRLAKQGGSPPQLLAGGYIDLGASGIIGDNGTLFFSAAKSTGPVIVSISSDGSNLHEFPLTSGAVVLGVDAANIYYSLDSGTGMGAMQMSMPRAGGTPTVINASNTDCFSGATDARYLYCSGIRPFRALLSGGMPTYLCNPVSSDLDNIILRNGRLYLFELPYLGVDVGVLASISIFGTGAAVVAGLDSPRALVADDSALYFVEYDQGTIKKVVLP